MSHYFFAPAFLFAVPLFQEAGGADAIAIAGGFDGIDRALLDVAIDRPAVNVDEFRGVGDFEQQWFSLSRDAVSIVQ